MGVHIPRCRTTETKLQWSSILYQSIKISPSELSHFFALEIMQVQELCGVSREPSRHPDCVSCMSRLQQAAAVDGLPWRARPLLQQLRHLDNRTVSQGWPPPVQTSSRIEACAWEWTLRGLDRGDKANRHGLADERAWFVYLCRPALFL